jgi:glucose-6-phosphate 1-epimerase
VNTTDISMLNANFGITRQVVFADGPGGLPVVTVQNSAAEATITLQGAHVLSFQPQGGPPVLWMSQHARFAPNTPIRGGIPLVFPWFGPHPTDPSKPQHGFARTMLWEVLGTSAGASGATQVRFGLHDTEQTRDLWPHAFALEYAVTVGRALEAELIVRNTGEAAYTWSGALHSYFTVGDVRQIAVRGLDGAPYLDKVNGGQRKIQHGDVTFDREIDRIYLDTDAACTIHDPVLRRVIHVAKQGSRSTVVWNPWIDKARAMADFGDDEYPGMVCVETANAADDAVTLAPGEEHRLKVIIAAE